MIDKNKKLFLELSYKKISEKEIELNQDKTQIISSLEKNKSTLGDTIFQEAYEFANLYKTYYIENTFVKMP